MAATALTKQSVSFALIGTLDLRITVGMNGFVVSNYKNVLSEIYHKRSGLAGLDPWVAFLIGQFAPVIAAAGLDPDTATDNQLATTITAQTYWF